MATNSTDKDIIEQLGESLTEAGYSEHAIKKWMQRGIPWKERGKVARLARSRRIKLPAHFSEVRAA